MSSNPNESRHEEHVNQVIADYLKSVEEGHPLDQQALLAKHPDLARDLASFFADRDRFEQAAAPLRASAGLPGVDEPTLDQSSVCPAGPGAKLRYFGDYELLEEIARGGMGVVYKARQVNLKRIVALKLILAGQLAGPQEVERFHAEAEAAAKLDHPGIVPIFEIGEHEGQHYFSMAYVEGSSLATKVAEGPLPPREAAELMVKIAAAIQYAHQQGIIHRDLKPANVLLDCNGHPRVTDFGLAKQLRGDSGLTGSGQILGTPSYMPPEQAVGKIEQIGPAADVYSLGAILYCLLTGRPPFQAASPMDTLLAVLEQEPVPPRQLNAQIPLDLETITLKCLEKSPGRRYAAAAEMAEELRRYLAGRPILARPVGRAERLWRWCKRQPVVAGLVAAIVVSLVLGTAVSSYYAIAATRQCERAEAGEKLAGDRLGQVVQEKKNVEAEKSIADANALRAENNAKSALRQLAVSFIDRGINELEHGDQRQGYAFLGQAYRAGSGAPDLRASSRALLGSWDCDLPRVLINGGPVNAIAFSPDGTRIAAASQDKTAHLWDAATGMPLGEPMKHDNWVNAVAFSPDGTMIATASADNTASLWDARTGKPLGAPMKHGGWVSAVAFSPDGTKVATASRDKTARLWDAATGMPLGTPMGHDGPVDAVVFSPDGTKLATASGDPSQHNGEARLWDAATCKPLGMSMKHGGSLVNAVAFSPDGTKLATASDLGTAQLWDAATGTPVGMPMKHYGAISAVAFSPDGTKIATASYDATVRLWDAATGTPLGEPIKHDHGINAVAFSPDGTKIATASNDATARLWDAATGNPADQPMKHDNWVDAVAFSPDGTKIATASRDKTVRLWDAATNNPLRMPSMPRKRGDVATAVAFSPDETKIATASWDHSARLWDVATGSFLGAPMEHDGAIYSVAFSPDGKKIATASGDPVRRKWEARLWDAATGKPLGTPMKHDMLVRAVAFSPDGTKIATASFDLVRRKGESRLWNAATGIPLGTPMRHDGPVNAVAFSPDGTKIATASEDRTARMWDMTTCKPSGAAMWHDDAVLAVAFSPDGTKIATASRDKTVRLWNAATGTPLGMPVKHGGAVSLVAFSPDGTKIATVSLFLSLRGGTGQRGEVRLWDAAAGMPLGTPRGYDGPVLAMAFGRDGTRVITAGHDFTTRIWHVPRSLPDDPAWIAAYVPVAAGYKEDIDGALHPISTGGAAASWAGIFKSPAWLEYRSAILEESRRALHESEAAHWEARRNGFAAAFHLRWLAKQDPKNVEIKNRLRRAEAEWAKTRERFKQKENQAPASELSQPAVPRLPPGTQTPPTTPKPRPSTQPHGTETIPPTPPGAPASILWEDTL